MEWVNSTAQINEKRLLWACKALFCVAALMTVFLLSYLVFGEISRRTPNPGFRFPDVNKALLGQGALALTARQSSPELQSILQELILVGANTRPDHNEEFTLALCSSGEQKKIFIGETVFLQSKDGRLGFSTEKSELALLPYSFENQQVLCEFKKSQEQCILTPSKTFSKPLAQESYVEILKKGSLWGADIFLSGWGGEEYRDLSKRVKVSLDSDVFFLSPGDCLWWNGERWVEENDGKKIVPIAQLIKTSSQGAHFQVWDETGFSSEKVHLVQQTFSQSHFKIDELMTGIRPRSSSEITCQLGKRRVIVKEGDWWIRSENRWKQVRSASDLDACLHHQIPGELFIFEKVEASKGKVVLKGRAFDRMRTSSEPISLVFQVEKKHSSSIKKTTSGNSELLAKNKSNRPLISNSSKEVEDL